ncbi:MAG: hypothetical protein JKY65_00815 [Planctomycetes bacterium]|nr:hypothetical protein [Planctomycetota bacterium]
MTVARRFLPDQRHSITRRCARRCFFLKPTPFVVQTLLYCLGVALKDNPLIALHGFLAEANHIHVVVHDLSGPDDVSQLSSFMRRFDSLVARALNTYYGRGENFWAPGSYDNCEIWNQASLESQLLYLWLNPVRDGLVPRPESWPGAKFLPEDFGTQVVIEKPEGAFFGGRGREKRAPTDPFALEHWTAELAREEERALEQGRERDLERKLKGKGLSTKRRRALERQRRNRVRGKQKARLPSPRSGPSALPDEVTIEIVRPEGYEGWSIERVRAHFRALLEAEIELVHEERREQGKTHYMGVEAVLAQDARDSAGSTWPTFARNPRIACKGDRVARFAILEELVAWRIRYRLAWVARKAGDLEVAFPLGTFLLRRDHQVQIRGATDPPRAAA